MKRQIFSKQTFFLRIILPMHFITMIAAATSIIYSHSRESEKSAAKSVRE